MEDPFNKTAYKSQCQNEEHFLRLNNFMELLLKQNFTDAHKAAQYLNECVYLSCYCMVSKFAKHQNKETVSGIVHCSWKVCPLINHRLGKQKSKLFKYFLPWHF